jgi:hypothetical protein
MIYHSKVTLIKFLDSRDRIFRQKQYPRLSTKAICVHAEGWRKSIAMSLVAQFQRVFIFLAPRQAQLFIICIFSVLSPSLWQY